KVLNDPNAREGMEPWDGIIVRAVFPENIEALLAHPLGGLLDGQNLANIDLGKIKKPGPLMRVAVAMRDARDALAASPTTCDLQALWDELLDHRLYGVIDDEVYEWEEDGRVTSLFAVLRPVDESLLGDLVDATRVACPPAAKTESIHLSADDQPLLKLAPGGFSLHGKVYDLTGRPRDL